jgi:hypothetical protein
MRSSRLLLLFGSNTGETEASGKGPAAQITALIDNSLVFITRRRIAQDADKWPLDVRTSAVVVIAIVALIFIDSLLFLDAGARHRLDRAVSLLAIDVFFIILVIVVKIFRELAVHQPYRKRPEPQPP